MPVSIRADRVRDEADVNTRLSVLLSITVMSGSLAAFAQTPPASPSSTTLTMRGTIQKYDASTRILSLSTANGTAQFALAATARIRQGLHKVDISQLEKLSGYAAAVRYSESDGRKTVESVHVFGKSERIAP